MRDIYNIAVGMILASQIYDARKEVIFFSRIVYLGVLFIELI